MCCRGRLGILGSRWLVDWLCSLAVGTSLVADVEASPKPGASLVALTPGSQAFTFCVCAIVMLCWKSWPFTCCSVTIVPLSLLQIIIPLELSAHLLDLSVSDGNVRISSLEEHPSRHIVAHGGSGGIGLLIANARKLHINKKLGEFFRISYGEQATNKSGASTEESDRFGGRLLQVF